MRIVLDASVGLKWLLRESDSAKALALRDDYIRQIHDLLVPDVFPVEIGHALARAERKGILKPPEGSQKLADMLSILPPRHETISLLPRAFEIASQMRIGVYDCLYVALAEQEHCELVTADAKLKAALHKQFPFIVDLASFP